MVVTRHVNGKEIAQADLKTIKLTDNPEVSQLIHRVVARIHRETHPQETSLR